MNILFLHNNFPAQFRNIAQDLVREGDHQVAAIGAPSAKDVKGVRLERYALPPPYAPQVHMFARRFDNECRRSEQVLKTVLDLTRSGFSPSLVVSHSGWGESLPLREAIPGARIVNYCEYYYRAEGQDVNFDPEFPFMDVEARVALQLKNASALLSLVEGDEGLSPTLWQRSTFPHELHSKIAVRHEGIDTDVYRPDQKASLTVPGGRTLTRDDEVVTFVARNLEPLRGYHIFMRAVPLIQKMRPNAQIVIVGNDGVSYGSAPPYGKTWKSVFLGEVAGKIDAGRLHFTGTLPASEYLKALQVSRVHVYLTYPFVVSWSLIEALSTGCVVVASKTGPVEEIIDGTNGLLVPFFDVDGIAHRVVDVLAAPHRYQAVRERARETAINDFGLEKCLAAVRGFLIDGA